MLTSEQQERKRKKRKIRNSEYYDMEIVFDGLYAKSREGKLFTHLMEIIEREENIKLAYRTIKMNSGSNTAGMDRRTIKNLMELSEEEYVRLIRKQFSNYHPRPVRRVEIPKPNGKMRPLGIPTIVDRIVQQCVLQVMEPICEAKFSENSNGFRPNRSAETAIAQCMRLIQVQHLYHVVDLDIKGFFDKLKYSGTTLDANIREYADGRQQIAIYAVDLAGNVSQKVYVKNPFYGRDDSGSSGNDSKPSATKKPSSGGAKTTPKPTATPIPTDVPQATMQPQTTAAPDIDALYALLAQFAGGMGTSEPTEGKPFSMGGNMKTVDLLYSKATNKQFITVQTRKGETYYLVIDYDKPLDKDGEQYETYFLNLVDDRDLFGVVSKDEQPTPEPTATPTPKPTAEPKPETEKISDSAAMMALVLLVMLIAGGAAAFVVLGKKRDAQPRYNTELDDDDDEEEIGEENEEE